MKARSLDAHRRHGGFTLIELIVVVIIIGILAAIAIPSFLGQRRSAQNAQAMALLADGQTNMEAFYAKDQSYAAADAAAMTALEPSFTWANGNPGTAQTIGISATTASSYRLSSRSVSGDWFSLRRDSSSAVYRCIAQSPAAAPDFTCATSEW